MANSRPKHHDPHAPWLPARTPSPLGINDAADPNVEACAGDTPGPLGCNDHAALQSESIFGGDALVVQGRNSHLTHMRPPGHAYLHSHGARPHGHAPHPHLPSHHELRRRRRPPLLASHISLVDLHVLGCRGGIPATAPRNTGGAPATINLPPEIDRKFHSMWQSTMGRLKADGFPREFSGALAKDAKNEVYVRNIQMGTSEGSPQDRILVEPGLVLIGTIHTHPKVDEPDFSWGDIARMVNDKDLVKVLQCGEEQRLLLRTGRTSDAILSQADMRDLQLKRLNELTAKGKSRREAVRISAHEAAVKYGLAYYEGKNGLLKLVTSDAHAATAR